jgi:hypothetical protein
MKRLYRLLICLVIFAALAANAGDASRRMEASMLVTGWIEVSPDGSVHDYTLDHMDKLPPTVVSLIAKTIAAWKFKPVLINGKPVLAKTRMNLRLVALPLGNGLYSARVRGETFGNGKSDEWVSYKERKPPGYPALALKLEVEGTVYLAVEVGRDGHVERASAQQVDLRQFGSERDMKLLRDVFAKVSIEAAKGWTFNPPTTGADVNADHWTTIVPVVFTIDGTGGARGYGEWVPYIPGPITPVPWEQDQLVAGVNTDALPDGSAFHPDNRFVLLNSQSD